MRWGRTRAPNAALCVQFLELRPPATPFARPCFACARFESYAQATPPELGLRDACVGRSPMTTGLALDRGASPPTPTNSEGTMPSDWPAARSTRATKSRSDGLPVSRRYHESATVHHGNVHPALG